MKNLMRVFLMLFVVGAFIACSSDDDSTQEQTSTFKIDGVEYDMGQAQPNGGVIQIISGFNEDGSSSAQIALSGSNGNKIGTVRFLINFMESDGISGTYQEGDFMDDIGVFDSEASIYMISEIVDGSQQIISSEGAEGTFKITHNANANYTIEYNVTYDDGTVSEASVTQDFVVQEI